MWMLWRCVQLTVNLTSRFLQIIFVLVICVIDCIIWLQYSSEEEEEGLDDAMTKLSKKKKVSLRVTTCSQSSSLIINCFLRC